MMHFLTKIVTRSSFLNARELLAVGSLSLCCLASATAHAVKVDLVQSKAWNGGYLMEATVTNTSNTTVDGWTLGFKLGNKIEKIARATVSGSDPYSISNLSYSAKIALGDSERFSFNASGTLNAANVGGCVFNGKPCELTVNGRPVGGGVTSSSPKSSASAAKSSTPSVNSSTPASKPSSSTPKSSAASTPPPNTSPNQVLWFGDVNKALTASFRQLNREPGEAGTAEVVVDGTHGEVWKINKPAGSKRAEFARNIGYIPKEGDKVYVGWRVKVDIVGSKNPSGGFAIFQLKTQGNGEQNHPVSIGFNGSKMNVQAIDPGTGCVKCRARNLLERPMSENTWTNIVLGFNFSKSASKGYVEVWINGVKQNLLNGNSNKQAAHRTIDTGEMYFKWGAYNEASRDFNINVFMDEMRVSKNYDQAEPSNYTRDGVYAPR